MQPPKNQKPSSHRGAKMGQISDSLSKYRDIAATRFEQTQKSMNSGDHAHAAKMRNEERVARIKVDKFKEDSTKLARKRKGDK